MIGEYMVWLASALGLAVVWRANPLVLVVLLMGAGYLIANILRISTL